MNFRHTSLSGAYVIEPVLRGDERGFFARSWCQREFEEHGLIARLVQCSISFNTRKGTLRGMHYQRPPSEEAKLVRCTRGSLYDVIIDLRSESSTFMQHLGMVLSADNHLALYVPEGFAHGFQTLEDNTEVFYQMSEFYAPQNAAGVRWNDPAFAIEWPGSAPILHERDAGYPDYLPNSRHDQRSAYRIDS